MNTYLVVLVLLAYVASPSFARFDQHGNRGGFHGGGPGGWGPHNGGHHGGLHSGRRPGHGGEDNDRHSVNGFFGRHGQYNYNRTTGANCTKFERTTPSPCTQCLCFPSNTLSCRTARNCPSGTSTASPGNSTSSAPPGGSSSSAPAGSSSSSASPSSSGAPPESSSSTAPPSSSGAPPGSSSTDTPPSSSSPAGR